MKMKKMMAGILSAALLTSLLAGCGGDQAKTDGAGADAGKGDKSTVTLWASGSDNVRSVFEKLETDFNANSEYKDQYTLKVQFIAVGGGGQALREKVVAAYKAGQKDTDFDLVELGDEDISVCLQEGGDDIFLPYDAAKIPNLAGVAARPAQGEKYAMPYRGTTVVLAYNSETVPTPPKTVDELTQWIKDHPTRFSYNSAGTGGAGDSFIRSSIYNFMPDEAFMSSDAKWADEWDAGFAYLTEIHPFLYQSGGKVVYPNKNQGALDLLANKEIDMCPAWADQAISQSKSGSLPASIKITQIEPSLTGAVNSFGIPSMGSNPEGAHAVMNYMLTPEAQNILLNDMAAIPLIDMAKLDQTSAETIKDLDVTKFRTQSIGALGTDLNKRWDETIATLN